MMETKKRMGKTMFMSIMTAVFFAFAFTACSDDLESDGADNMPAGVHDK